MWIVGHHHNLYFFSNVLGGPSSLQVECVELYTRDNAREHNTFMYDLVDGTKPVLILRRGQPFSIAIRFKRNYNPQQDRLKLEIGFEDSVYMEDEQWRKEYVLSDVGKIFTGSFKQPVGRRWIFGQVTLVYNLFKQVFLSSYYVFHLDRCSDLTCLHYRCRNFHVWNDCWMARPDLPTGYGGWQAYDSTPQETSEGVYQTGPASVLAVQRGEIGYMFDSPFVFSEVNADVVHWQQDDSSETGYRKLKRDSYRVGRLLLTKKIGVDDDFGDADAEDITDQYKNKEGTDEERMSVLNAARSSGFNYAFNLPSPEKEDVYFNLLDIEKIKIGQPFHVTVNIENQSGETRTVSAVLSASSIYYTGITGRKIKRENGNFSLQPHQKEVLSIEVTPDEYLEKLVDYAMIKLYAIATVKETQQMWSEEDDFMVEKPNLELEIRGNLQVGTPFVLAISLTNPLKSVLDNYFFTIEAPGVTGAFRVTNRDIQPEEVAVHTVRLIPQKPGPRKIVATFSSRQLIQVVGSKQVEVLD
ncbi:hemocyte protein-glutamine gamma-glutamyltransferase-like [Tachypleus tridentatus]|uniref:hemocyte protein-glutamine gamma-glutamyltransferase-like n=1 Tax=Tachypleus tridentatus TaxID=6853 RepID=UPI003FD1804F